MLHFSDPYAKKYLRIRNDLKNNKLELYAEEVLFLNYVDLL